ncbi:MAG: hybrid sensor histidine kinase/response regulator [Magnetococcales bacterium]|nr:hybrid sensor histidine kinase/response regulator [Magnetococcales bacterium]
MRQKILLVDDDTANLKLLREILQNDYDLMFAKTGGVAISLAEKQPDLILLDIMLPEVDGYEVCAQLKSNPVTQDIPVIFVTVRTSEEDETRGFVAGAVDYITKPVSGPIVLARVRTQLSLLEARRELERRNEELRQAALQREVVEQIMRHDLKSPLNTIVSVPEILLEELSLNSTQEKLLRMVAESGYNLLEQINRTLDLYKMEQGTYFFEPALVDLLEALDRIRFEINDLLRVKRLGFEMRVDGRLLKGESNERFPVAGDKLLLRAMLSNLIRNAAEASPVGEVVMVSLSRAAEQVVVAIHNKGGVPLEIRERFFDKFTTFGKKRGTGLGTYSARLIARTHGGEIRLDTGREGMTTVEIRLPFNVLSSGGRV